VLSEGLLVSAMILRLVPKAVYKLKEGSALEVFWANGIRRHRSAIAALGKHVFNE
jgi:hypothetical protein